MLGWTGWGPRDIEPTTLIALWPDTEAPTRPEVLAALAQAGLENHSNEEAGPPSPDILWTAVLRRSADAPPMIVWAEAAEPMEPGELGDDDAEKCKWIVGFQTILEPSDPLRSLVEMFKLVSAGAGDGPALLDVNARRWLLREQVDLLAGEGTPLPPSELLWTIEAVEKEQAGGGVWLRTQGLLRCGRPELEMVEVPSDHANVAAALLNDVAGLVLETALPEPGEPFEIGVGLTIALQPWSVVGPYLGQGAAGSDADRAARSMVEAATNGAPDSHIAVVCAAEPVGQFRKLWVWPGDVAQALAEDGAAVYKTTRATERTAALAQFTWPELAMTWSKVRKADAREDENVSGAVMLIKVGYEIVTDDAPAREHLWFMVREIAGDRARGQLINQPMHVTTMQEGEDVWIAREGVSDWRLVLPRGIVQPSDMLMRSPGLNELLATLESAP